MKQILDLRPVFHRLEDHRVKAMEGVEDLDVQALKDSPAYGVRNVQTVSLSGQRCDH